MYSIITPADFWQMYGEQEIAHWVLFVRLTRIKKALIYRFHALDKTNEDRSLHITFTLRNAGESICDISARDMHRKERKIYEQTT